MFISPGQLTGPIDFNRKNTMGPINCLDTDMQQKKKKNKGLEQLGGEENEIITELFFWGELSL